MINNSDDQKLQGLLKQLESEMSSVFENNNYIKYLITMSKFHNYSYRNSLLISMQKPEATNIASYNLWKTKFNRQVIRGSKGIEIIGYAPKKINIEQEKKNQHGKTMYNAAGQPIMESVTKKIPKFIPIYLFDVSQTAGEPLPNLENNLYDNNIFIKALSKISPLPIEFKPLQENIKYYCDPVNQKIKIKDGMIRYETIKSIIHAITHADLYSPNIDLLYDHKDINTKELEAKSTAFILCEHYGVDTSDYTFPDIKFWSQRQTLDDLKSCLDTIQKQANELISCIDDNLKELILQQQPLAFQLNDLYFSIQPIESGYDYSIYDKNFKLLDGGVYDNPNITIDKAINLIVEDDDIKGISKLLDRTQAKQLNYDRFVLEADNANAIQGINEFEKLSLANLDSIKFDNDIDLDKEKSRKQLGFRDNLQNSSQRISMKDRITIARSEAEHRAAKKENTKKITTERNEI